MSFPESFYTYLAANSTITATLASANAIWPEYIPQSHDGFPAMSYSLADDEDVNLLNGDVSDAHVAVMQLSIYDRSFKSVNDAASAVKSELIGYRGAMGSHTVDHVMKDGEITLPPEGDTGLLGVRLTFRLNYY